MLKNFREKNCFILKGYRNELPDLTVPSITEVGQINNINKKLTISKYPAASISSCDKEFCLKHYLVRYILSDQFFNVNIQIA